ncbi:hypothetical protein [Natronorubrum thiooxidans]|uniref:Uncharacterized protein n=1 Tax=Natronorubrum thiooxidans TaxID=308853 RepID=A0A1N7EUD4_9EURY|nr:hypothetical protein [Natronorubrum thiooxidans]SIR91710.1 hypothetical protein SAMN05421752_10565 [Natronorubrum thiooxidans]
MASIQSTDAATAEDETDAETTEREDETAVSEAEPDTETASDDSRTLVTLLKVAGVVLVLAAVLWWLRSDDEE